MQKYNGIDRAVRYVEEDIRKAEECLLLNRKMVKRYRLWADLVLFAFGAFVAVIVMAILR